MLVGHKLCEMAVVAVRLAGHAGRVVGERHPECAAFAGVKLMHAAGHAGRHAPLRHRVRVEQGPVDGRARRSKVAADPC